MPRVIVIAATTAMGMLIDWPERYPLSDEGRRQLDLASRNVCITLIFPAVVGQPHTW
jgi:hypothetical protein